MKFQPLSNALACAIASALVAAAPALAQTAKPAPAVPAAIAAAPTGPVATVNGVAIPQQRSELLIRERAQQGQPDSPQLRSAVRDELINREIISQEAVKSGLTKKAELQNELELVRQTVIVQAFLREYIRTHPITDAEMQKEYDRIKAELGDKEYKARHILVGTEEEAKAAIAELRKGAKFDDLARKLSKDDGTKAKGGDLEWQAPGTFDKDFSSAMVKLAKGKFSETPVKTRFGYHVIQLDDTRSAQHPPFAEVKANLSQRLQRTRIEHLIAELRAKAKVE
ncbi:MAG: peptidylprolyl isomerase [Proteobacteria bacterium]|nr:peptidylprolyl isomerase [Pseudomonadota bacterium]